MIALLFALATGVASAEEAKDLDFDLEGYYRTRGYMFKELFASPIDGPGEVARPNGTEVYAAASASASGDPPSRRRPSSP